MADRRHRPPSTAAEIRDLQDRFAAANDAYRHIRLHLVVLPSAEAVTSDPLDRPKQATIAVDRIPALAASEPVPEELEQGNLLPRAALLGCSKYEYWGTGNIRWENPPENAEPNVLLFLIWQGRGASQAARQFDHLAVQSARLYQTLPSSATPIDGTTSSRNLWATALYARLAGTKWVAEKDGIPYIALPFAASIELWRRLWHGITPSGGRGIPPKPQTKRQAVRAPRDQKLEARDCWIYARCMKGLPYKTILTELAKQNATKDWPRLKSVQGLRAAGRNYARRHGLAEPPKRHDL
jgi:hypothetical protein